MRQDRVHSQPREALDALITDAYLDALLAAGEASPEGLLPTVQDEDEGGDRRAAARPAPELRRAGDVVAASLVRVHPSFRFEERLAARLAQLAAANASQAVAAGGGRTGDVIPFPGATPVLEEDPLLQAVLDGRLDPTDASAVARAAEGALAARVPLIVGGASAAISLVGVAWVAWRATRTSSAPMARAARAAHARRLSDLTAGMSGGPV